MKNIKITDVKKLLKLFVKSKESILLIDGFKIKNKEKYSLFLKKGLKCKCCGLKPYFISIETDNNCKNGFAFLTVYGNIGKTNIKMTIDHIIPKALGGRDEIDNYQILCEICNREKGDKIIIY